MFAAVFLSEHCGIHTLSLNDNLSKSIAVMSKGPKAEALNSKHPIFDGDIIRKCEVTPAALEESFCGKGLLVEAAGKSADFVRVRPRFPSWPSRARVCPAGRWQASVGRVVQAGSKHPADTPSQVGRVV